MADFIKARKIEKGKVTDIAILQEFGKAA